MTLDNGTDGQTDGQTDRQSASVRRPPPREEGRIITHRSHQETQPDVVQYRVEPVSNLCRTRDRYSRTLTVVTPSSHAVKTYTIP